MATVKHILQTGMIGLAILGTTACQHTAVGTPAPFETSIRNSVQMERLPFLISPEADGTDSLSHKTEVEIHAFLSSVQAGYGDTLILDAPAASPYRIDAITSLIRKRGLSFAGIAPTGQTPAAGAAVLYVERHRVITPKCGSWTTETSNQQRNNDSAYLGCANTANLGLMVADPRDLTAGHSTGNSTAAAVGAIYTPTPQPTGPVMTLSLEGLGNLPAASPATPSSN